MSSSLQVPRMRAAARRVKAGGERFLGGVLPGASARRLQIRAFADDWAADNLEAKQATGPLWIVLGDSVSQGIGASTREVGYVGVVHELLRRRDAWRVINLSRAGAGIADVLARQLPELAALTAEEPAALVSCLIGVEDLARRTPGLDMALRQVLASLPTGAVVGTLARGARSGPAAALDAVVREEAARHRMRIAELPPRFGPGGRGRGAAFLNDVEHAAWAKAVIAAVDSPPAEIATSTDPQLPVVPPVDAAPATATAAATAGAVAEADGLDDDESTAAALTAESETADIPLFDPQAEDPRAEDTRTDDAPSVWTEPVAAKGAGTEDAELEDAELEDAELEDAEIVVEVDADAADSETADGEIGDTATAATDVDVTEAEATETDATETDAEPVVAEADAGKADSETADSETDEKAEADAKAGEAVTGEKAEKPAPSKPGVAAQPAED